MFDQLREKLTFANTVSLLALFVALGGSSYAAFKLPRNSVGSGQIKNGAVNSAKVRDRSLRARDFAPGQIPSGAQGPKGDTGPKGNTGPPGPSTGPAGGDLSGTYPNPTIAPLAVTDDKIGSLPSAAVGEPIIDECTGGTSVPNDTFTGLVWTSESYDNGDMHDTGCPEGGELHAPVTGAYLVTAEIVWAPNATGSRFLGIEGPSGLVASDERNAVTDSGEWTQQSTSTLIHLVRGDTVDVEVRQKSGGALDIVEFDQRPHFAMTWVSH